MSTEDPRTGADPTGERRLGYLLGLRHALELLAGGEEIPLEALEAEIAAQRVGLLPGARPRGSSDVHRVAVTERVQALAGEAALRAARSLGVIEGRRAAGVRVHEDELGRTGEEQEVAHAAFLERHEVLARPR